VLSLAHGAHRLEQWRPNMAASAAGQNVRKVATHLPRRNHDFVIQKGGNTVYPRLVAADHHRQFSMTTFRAMSKDSITC
jgi:circadian clock protein KaiC